MGIPQYSVVRIHCYLSNKPKQYNENELIALFALLRYDTAFACGLALEEVNQDNIVLYTQSKRTYAIDLVINLECFRRAFDIDKLYVEVFANHYDDDNVYLYESTQLPKAFVISRKTTGSLLSIYRILDNSWFAAKRAMFDSYCRVEDLLGLFSVTVTDEDLDLISKFTLVEPRVPSDCDRYDSLGTFPSEYSEGYKRHIRELLTGKCENKAFLRIVKYALQNEFKYIRLDEMGQRIRSTDKESPPLMDDEMYGLLLPPLRPFVQSLKKNPKLRERIKLAQLLTQE